MFENPPPLMKFPSSDLSPSKVPPTAVTYGELAGKLHACAHALGNMRSRLDEIFSLKVG